MSIGPTFRFTTHAVRFFAELDGRSKPASTPEASLDLAERSHHEWDYWSSARCVVLLGEPGIGKSTEFLNQYQKLRLGGTCSFFSKWQDWYEGDDVFATLDDHHGFLSALRDGHDVSWFIDALDEGRIKTDRAFDILQKGLRSLSEVGLLGRVKLRLSCRSRDWRQSEAQRLRAFFGHRVPDSEDTSTVAILRLLPLDSTAVRTLALEKLELTGTVDRFLEAVAQRHVSALVGHPLLLAMMLAIFQRGQVLGDDRTSLYEQSVELLVTEQNQERRDHAAPDTLPARRIEIARALAVLVTLGGKDLIAVPDTDAVNERTLNATASGAARQELLETLNTALFTQRIVDGFSFVHRSFAEYLAALEIAHRLGNGKSTRRLTSLFPVEHGAVPSPIRETAAWLCGLDAAFRGWIIQRDALTAAQGDTVRYTAQEREAIILALAERFHGRSWQREFDATGDLAHSVAPDVLRRLLEPAQSPAVRHFALALIDTADAQLLFSDLLSLASDANVEQDLRREAAKILCKRAPGQYAIRLVALLTLSPEEDSEDEIAGTVLEYLYPSQIGTEEALSALRVPRAPFTYGLYRHFWRHSFLPRLRCDRDERALVLNAIAPLMTRNSDSIALRAFVSIFAKLLLEELRQPELDFVRIGPWLMRLWMWMRDNGTDDENSREEVILTLRSKPSWKRLFLDWRLDDLADDNEFMPWYHLPFYDSLATPEDGALWVALSEKYTQKAASAGLFRHVIGLLYDKDSSVGMEKVVELAKRIPRYGVVWEQERVCMLDGPAAQVQEQRRKRQEARTGELAAEVAWVRARMGAVRAGDHDELISLIWRVSFEPFGEPPVAAIAERYGEDVAEAVHDGLLKAWRELDTTSELWPYSNTLPNWAIVVGFGYRVAAPALAHADINEHQLDYLVWHMLHSQDEMESLLDTLWTHYPEAVWQRVEQTLSRERDLTEESHPWLWAGLAALDRLPRGILDAIAHYARAEGLPSQAQARRYALRLLLAANSEDIADLLAKVAHEEWNSRVLPAPWAEPAAVAIVAAWWLLKPQDAFTVLRNLMFVGPRHHARAVAFVNAVQQLQGHHTTFSSHWPDTVEWSVYADLLPLLYARPPRTRRPVGPAFVGEAERFAEARDRLVSYLATAPVELARRWFGLWKGDERFGVHRDWFASLVVEITQRHADEAWTPLAMEAIGDILNGNAALGRSEADIAEYLDEVIDTQLLPAFRSDHSLASLLWEGTKKRGRRKHSDEKALQTAVYGQLVPMLHRIPLIGAREPEVFDAKKPDARFSYIVQGDVRVDIPVEMKWSDHRDLWNATTGQVLQKYMQDPNVRHAVYLVGWAGEGSLVTGHAGEKPDTPAELREALQRVNDDAVAGTGKIIRVHVIDVTVLD